MSSPAEQPSQAPVQAATGYSKRAKVACKACHRRRVKCDAAESQPCWHCRLRGTRCELIESRRGKYARRRPAGTESSNAVASTTKAKPPTQGVLTPQTAQEELYHTEHPPSLAQRPSPPTSAGRLLEHRGEGRGGQSEGPEMLYARLAESEPSPASPESQSLTGNMRSYYMGESFSLAFVVKSLSGNLAEQRGLQPKLHYPIPSTVAEHAQNSAEGLKDSDSSTLAYLNLQGAFTLPPQDISDELVYIFFECVHPAFPVFDRQEFCALYQQKRVSLLALQTIYFLSSIICSGETLKMAGFHDRFSARRAFYLRAKALYDMDCERNKVNLAAVLFLMGFWWEGPEDQKDTWHWLGAAISLAQTLGMHRSTLNSGMSPRHRSLWKRIWWSIYIRDRHAAAALGRPCRIHDEDCDIEMLDTEDFLIDHGFDGRLVCAEQQYHRLYVIEMAKLAAILGRLLSYEFAPRSKTKHLSIDHVGEELHQWELNLPVELRRQPVTESLDAPFWSSMLHASYYNCQILLSRPPSTSMSFEEVSYQRMARIAADSITRIVEDLLAGGILSLGQLHLVPAIFAALSIHTLVIRGNDSIQKQLAENRARQCILGMSELAKGWPVAGWILRLFINLMKKLTGQHERCDGSLTQQTLDNSDSNIQPRQQSVQIDENTSSFGALNPDSYVMTEIATSAPGSEQFGLTQTDQLMSDVIWGHDENDFDLMLNRAQSNSLFPFHLG